MAEILKQQSSLKLLAGDWKQLADLSAKRMPLWNRLDALRRCGLGLAALDPVNASTQAIVQNRLLLETTDHVSPLIRSAADALRAALTSCRRQYGDVRAREMRRLEDSDAWKKLSPEQRKQMLTASPVPDQDNSSISTEEELIAALQTTPLQQWSDRTDAIASRIDKLLTDAARLLEPKVQQVRISSPTLHNESEVKAWIATQEQPHSADRPRGTLQVEGPQ